MKKVLVTGAAGTVGLQVLRYLLSEGKYEITVLELKNKHVYKRLKKFRKRINIVYGDVNDGAIVDALIKDHDVVIHLAGVLPPFANAREDLTKIVDYEGTKNIVDAIRDYNPKCYLIYSSSTSVYGMTKNNDSITVRSKGYISKFDFYSNYKLKAETYIKENLKNYTIFRLSYVFSELKNESVIYNVPLNMDMEGILSDDAGYAFVSAIDFKKQLLRKTYNLSGGEKFRVNYRDYLYKVLTTYGLSWRFLATFIFSEKNYYGGFYTDGENLNDILNFRTKNINFYYSKIEKYKSTISRFVPRILAIPFVLFLKKKKNSR